MLRHLVHSSLALPLPLDIDSVGFLVRSDHDSNCAALILGEREWEIDGDSLTLHSTDRILGDFRTSVAESDSLASHSCGLSSTL